MRAMRREWVAKRFLILLPLAVGWARRQERRILRLGVPLTESEIEDARALGVREIARVRLLKVNVMPLPGASALRGAARTLGFDPDATCGITLGYGIFIREDCWRHRALIAHELAHTAQYERLGGIEPFLRKYLSECLTVGYVDSPLEREAAAAAATRLPLV